MKKWTITFIVISSLLLSACDPSLKAEIPHSDYEISKTEPAPSEIMPEESAAEMDETQSQALLDTEDTPMFGEKALLHLYAIADEIGGREPGSAEEARTADYIWKVFKNIGYEPVTQYFSVEDEEEHETFSSANVIAIKEGESDEMIVVGAHYDAAYEEGTRGADDNASGVAVLLESAEFLFSRETPYTILFVAFGSEELALNGSNWFVEQLPEEELDKIIGMVNLDSLIAGDILYVYGNDGRGTMRDWLLEDADQNDLEIEGKTDEELLNSDGTPCECADYDAFEKAEIPYVFFEATNWDLSPDAMTQVDPAYGVEGEIRHTKYDTLEYINNSFPGRIEEHLSTYSLLLFDLLTEYK